MAKLNAFIQPQFDDAGNFVEGLAPVRTGSTFSGKWGYIDKTGKYVIKPEFDEANDFADGLAAVRIGEKWGYIS